MRVYVAGNYSINEDGKKASAIEMLENIRQGTTISAYLMSEGYNVFCPWLDYQYAFYRKMPDKRYKDNSMAWLEVSDAMLVISGQGLGGGVDTEIERASELGIPVFYSMDDLFVYMESL